MKTSPDHLPDNKQEELKRILDILRQEFEARINAAQSPARKQGRILKVILFGSHARGDWVMDPKGGYFSDYDLLIIVNDADFTDTATYWYAAEDRILADQSITTVVNFIVHTLDEVNRALKQGQYFFCDIIEDGVMLYELNSTTPSGNKKHRLATPTPPDPQTALRLATRYFEERLPFARSHLIGYRAYKTEKLYKHAAFELHQATEQTYAALLLTFTLYSPKTHNIKRLRSFAEQADERLIEAWPRGGKPYERYFELLKRAYVEARYSEHFEIRQEELEWLEACIIRLQALVEQSCQEHLIKLARSVR